MGDKLIRRVVQLLVALHLFAWLAGAVTWTMAWREGRGPSGPLYNSAKDFIGSLDILVQCNVDQVSMKTAQNAATWFSMDLGALYAITFACLILLGGTLQWFLLGRLVQWVATRKGRAAALSILGVYGVWAAGALFLWVAA
jgi:hypothetical protein